MHENSNPLSKKTMAIESVMKARLESAMELYHFEVKDFTGRHLNHKLHDGGFHLEAIIVSNDFEGDNLIQRHRKVYDAMGELMNHEIHALSMKTFTSTEWETK
jgi:BolA protein